MPHYSDYDYSSFSGVSDQRKGLLKTYTWMFFGVLLTALTSFLMYTTGLYYYFCVGPCLLYTSPSPRDGATSRMPSYA